MLGQRGEEREQEVALMKEKMARMEEALARTTSSNTGSGGGRRRRPSYRPPPVYVSQNESHHRGSVHDRLAPPIEDGQAKEVVVFRQPVPSTQRRSGSDRAQSLSRVSSASCTSTYTTGSYEHSHGTESHETVPLEDEDNQGTTDPPRRVINGLKRVDTVKDAAQESFLTTRTPKKKIEKGTKRAMILYNLGGKFMCIY
ncbi:hypothetical protein RHGRI_035425 [Rhododendron griersonianum]|uniref:Uncharacterized protein n=1 Tax=Rhododendron griersonianum TaxID=479676 RepID=A0AAV6IAH0_9ERIC|nr:hypothetical protein RHGRI_035425 [Rhododendron griersonianum]